MILNFYARQKQARAMCASQGLTLKYEHDSKGPRTDGKIIYVPYPSPEWSEDALVMWEANLYHEMGHNVKGMNDIFPLNDKLQISMDSFIGNVWNLVDDARQEYHKHDEYLGKQQIMSKGHALHTKRVLDGKFLGTDNESQERNALEAMLAWDTKHREPWMPHLSGMGEQIAEQLSEKGRGYYEQLMATGDDLLTYNTTAEEEYEKVKQILDLLQFDSQAEEEKGQAQAKSGKGKAGDSKDDGDGSQGEGDQNGAGKMLRHKHGDGEKGKGEAYAHGAGGGDGEGGEEDTSAYPWESPTSFDYQPPDGKYIPRPDSMKVYDFSDNRDCITSKRGYVEDTLNGLPSSNGLASKTRRLLQVYSQSHYQHGLKQGRVGKNLHRATMSQAGGYQQKIFKRKIENNILDTSVEVLVDCSGSMSGEKFEHAGHSAIMLNEAISKIGVPVEVTGFTETGSGPLHFVFKGFNERVQKEDLADRFAKAASRLHANADGESILWAYDRLIKQKTKRKLMIVISDGWPAAYNESGDINEFTKGVCQAIEKSPVELYGIGVMDDAVKQFYKNWTVINDSAELENALLGVIKNKIIGK